MANLQELIRQREEIERQIKQMQESSRVEAIATIRELMQQHNLSPEDLNTPLRARKAGEGGGSGKGGKGSTVAPKYRDPHSEKTWTGRGLKPKWVTEALNSGKTLEDLAIR